MNQTYTYPTQRLPWYVRGMLVLMGAGLIAMLIVAMCLTPSAKGYGTHTQIVGLQPCSFTQILGFRCPSCGMTTSWAYFVRGNVVQSAKSNSGGMLLALAATLVGPWVLVSGILGRWWIRQPNEWVVVAVATLIVVVTLLDWWYRLTR